MNAARAERLARVKRFLARRGPRELAWSLASAVVQVFIGLGTTVLLSRLLGPPGLGILTVALAVSFLVSGVADVGLTSSFTRIASPTLQAGQSIRHQHTLFLALRLTLLISVALSVLLLVPWVAPSLQIPADLPWLTPAAAVAGIALGVGGHYASVLQSLRRQQAIALVRWTAGLVRLAGYALTGWLLGPALDVVVALALGAIVLETGLMASAAHRAVRLRPAVWSRPPRAWIRFSLWAVIPSISYNLVGQTDTVLLAAMQGPEQTGEWAAAARLAGVLILGTGAVWSVALPYGTTLVDRAHLDRYLRLVRYGLVALVAAGSLGILLVPLAVKILYGPSFADSAGPARVLLAGNVASGLLLVLLPIAFRMRRERLVAAMGVMQFLTNLAGDLLLIPKFGALGCAFATLAAQTVSLIMVGHQLRQSLRHGAELPPLEVAAVVLP